MQRAKKSTSLERHLIGKVWLRSPHEYSIEKKKEFEVCPIALIDSFIWFQSCYEFEINYFLINLQMMQTILNNDGACKHRGQQENKLIGNIVIHIGVISKLWMLTALHSYDMKDSSPNFCSIQQNCRRQLISSFLFQVYEQKKEHNLIIWTWFGYILLLPP